MMSGIARRPGRSSCATITWWDSPATAAQRHWPAGPVGRHRSARELHLHLLRQRSLHEHGRAEERADPFGARHHHQPGRSACGGWRAAARRTSSRSWPRMASTMRPRPAWPTRTTTFARSSGRARRSARLSCTCLRPARPAGASRHRKRWRWRAERSTVAYGFWPSTKPATIASTRRLAGSSPWRSHLATQKRFAHLGKADVAAIEKERD